MSSPMRTLDVFPANVHITAENAYPSNSPENLGYSHESSLPGSIIINLARVISSNGILYIGVDSPNGPALTFREEFTEQITFDRNLTRFVTRTNRIVIVNKDTSCGCGSRLKNWSIVSGVYGV